MDINDLPNISNLARFILYADDANILISGSTIDEVIAATNSVLNSLSLWVDTNRLLLNLKKTHYMIFTRLRNNFDHLLFKLNDVVIKREKETKFLGVIIDEGLTWKRHITTVRSKMSRYLGIMYKLRTLIPLKARMLIFHSFIQSHLNYCSLVWGFAARSTIDSLFSKQKCGMRAVMSGFVNYKYNKEDGSLPTHTKSSFNEHQILTIHGMIIKNALLFMHQVKHFKDSLPRSIIELISDDAPCFSENPDFESHLEWNTVYNSSSFRSSIFFKGPLLSISEENKTAISRSKNYRVNLVSYKNSVKSCLLEQQNCGPPDKWPTFLLNNIHGLRSSTRQVLPKI